MAPMTGMLEWKDTASLGRTGRRNGGVTLYVSNQLEGVELYFRMDKEPTKSLWVRIKGRAGPGNFIMGFAKGSPTSRPYKKIGGTFYKGM